MLLVCTANQCRSPMAELLLRHRLAAAGLTATVRSAGLAAGGHPATPHAVAVMADRGLDLAAHRSRSLDAALLASADLVIGMADEHVQAARRLDRRAAERAFTLRELAALAEAAGPRAPDEALGAWIARLAMARGRAGWSGELPGGRDVEDPVGRDRAAYEHTAELIDALLARVVELALPALTPSRRPA